MSINLQDHLSKTWCYTNNLQGQLKMAILSAGLGSRMKPLTTYNIPKPMFPIGGGTPMIDLWVRKAINSGITDISMNLCVLSETIKGYFGDGSKFGASISYIDEKVPSGTLGGACKQILGANAKKVDEGKESTNIKSFSGSTVFVISGDILSNFDSNDMQQMYNIHKKNGAAMTILLTPVPWEHRGEFGTAELKKPETLNGKISKSGRIKSFREKDPNSPSNLNNCSIYIVEVELLKILDLYRTKAIPDPKSGKPFYDFGQHVFPSLLRKNIDVKLPKDFIFWGAQYNDLWFDVGRKRDYLDVNSVFLNNKIKLESPYQSFPWGYLGNNVKIDFSKVDIIPPVIIGNNCIIEDDASIGPYAVIGDNWKIESESNISNSVLWHSFHDGPNSKGGNFIPGIDPNTGRSEIRRGVIINESIIAGGQINSNVSSKAIAVSPKGNLKIVGLDWAPKGKRA